MTGPDGPDSADLLARDERALMDQIAAGVALVEEHLDVAWPTWRGPNKGGRPPTSVTDETGAATWRLVYAQLCTAWLNLGGLLIKAGVPAWELPELRGVDGQSVMRFAADGSLDVSEDDFTELAAPSTGTVGASIPVRPVERSTEPRYTLDEARAILAGPTCPKHEWAIVLDDQGNPVAVSCEGCDTERPVR